MRSGRALPSTVALAGAAETVVYHRFCLAGHRNMAGTASLGTAIAISHVAAATQPLRIGSGGIRIPSHAPLVIAEQFGTLATHFAPALLEKALSVYRTAFKPSQNLSKPHKMIAVGVCAAETDAEAQFLRSSQVLAFARLVAGQPGKLPLPVHGVDNQVPSSVLGQVKQALSHSATGSPAMVDTRLRAIIEKYQPDELLVTGMIHDHGARVRSFDIVADVLTKLVSGRKTN